MDNYKLPSCVQPLSHQCAGHKITQKDPRYGMLESPDGYVVKPVQSPPRGLRELNFYQRVFDEVCSDEILLQLQPLMPRFHGMWTNEYHPDIQYFQLEDITRPFVRPCVLDIKVGEITWDQYATEEKIRAQKAKYEWLQQVKFQLLGMRVNSLADGEVFYDRPYTKALSPEKIVPKGFEVFFQKDLIGLRCLHIIRCFLHRLNNVKKWFNLQNRFKMFASSLLFVYEGDTSNYPSGGHVCSICSSSCAVSMRSHTPECLANAPSAKRVLDNLQTREQCVSGKTGTDGDLGQNNKLSRHDDQPAECPWLRLTDLRMIDFAHVFDSESSEFDQNYLDGLQSTITYLEKCLH